MQDTDASIMVIPDAFASKDTTISDPRLQPFDSRTLFEDQTRSVVAHRGSLDEKMANLANATAECAELAAELEERNDQLSQATALGAELIAEMVEKNSALDVINHALSQANANSAELMATLELRDIRISELNTALSRANAEAAELMASLDISKGQLAEANNILERQNEELLQTNESLRLADIELRQQTEQLICAEQQRVMIESLGAACHHLGQPFTVLALYLDMINRAETRPDYKENILAAIQAIDEIRVILQRFRQLHTYRTEPYFTSLSPEKKMSRILAL